MEIKNLTVEQRNLLIKSLNEYDNGELFDLDENSDLEKLFPDNIIPIGYTTEGSMDQYEIQITFNMNTMRWEEFINQDIYENKHVNYSRTFEEFCEEIGKIDFDEAISYCVSECGYREDTEKAYELLESYYGKEMQLKILWCMNKLNLNITDMITKNNTFDLSEVEKYYQTNPVPTNEEFADMVRDEVEKSSGLKEFIDSLNKGREGTDKQFDNKKQKYK